MPDRSEMSPARPRPPRGRKAWLALLPLAATSVQAQQGAPAAAETPQIVISATRLPGTPSGLAQNVTIIDAAQIRESQPARVEDLLGRIDGVYVDQAGAGGFSSVYLRGAENSHLLVLVDGVKVNDPTTTRGSAYDLSSIDVNQVERIELLRGPASAVHGGEALAGVINIVTKRRTEPGLGGQAYGAAGQDGYRKLGASLAFGGEVVSGQLSVGSSRDGDRGGDAFLKLGTVSASLRLTPAASVEGSVFVHRTTRESDAFPDDSGGPRLAVNREKTHRNARDLSYGTQWHAGDIRRLRFQLAATVFERDEMADNVFVDGGVRFPVPAFVSDTRFRRTTFNLSASRQWGQAASVVAGVERQSESGDLTSVGDFTFDGIDDTLPFSLKRRTDSLFAEARWRPLAPLSLQIGLRRDKVEGLDAETTPHLGAVWDLANGETTLKASYSQGFKPPSFFALGFPIGGNPDLKPERSRNLELTAVHRFDGRRSSMQLSVFRIDYKDLVDFDANTFTNVNRGAVVVRGIEPSLQVRLGDRLRAQVGLTLLDIDEQDGQARLRNRPERRASASVGYDIDARSSLFAAIAHTGTFLDRSNPTGDIQMPAFTTLDLAYSLRLGRVDARLAIDNLLDESYEPYVGFAGRERRLRAELRTSF